MDSGKRNRIKRRKKHQRKAANLHNKGGISSVRKAEGKRPRPIWPFDYWPIDINRRDY